MTLLGVPWAVGAWTVGSTTGKPEVSADAARALAHMVTGDFEGVAGPGDLAVVPLGAPGAAVNVRKGVVSVLNRAAGVLGQSYVSLNDGDVQVAVSAVGSGGSRTDLVAYVVEDPQYPGQPLPADGATGPYERFRVFEGVGANVDRLADVAPGQTGVALARITRPAGTTTVQAAHITSLRDIPHPRSTVVKKAVDVGDKATFDQLNAADYERFPQAAQWDVKVPIWATVVQLELRVTGARVSNDGTDAGDFRGKARLKLGGVTTGDVIVNPDIPNANKGNKFAYSVQAERDVPQATRGSTVSLEAQAFRVSSSSGVEVREAAGTTVIAEVRFLEVPNTDPVESFR